MYAYIINGSETDDGEPVYVSFNFTHERGMLPNDQNLAYLHVSKTPTKARDKTTIVWVNGEHVTMHYSEALTEEQALKHAGFIGGEDTDYWTTDIKSFKVP